MKKILKLHGILAIFSLLIGIFFFNNNLRAAEVTITSNFFTVSSQRNLVLTVSGPNGHFTIRKFKDIILGKVDQDGNVLEDGSYNYEIVEEPLLDQAQKNVLIKARETGDMKGVQALRDRGIIDPASSVVSGHFTIKDGDFLVSDEIEESESSFASDYESSSSLTSIADGMVKAFDQKIQDDLIVVGSICTGLDCVSNENFNFDTIRLKENNLRIKFQDTSSSSSFPTIDWELIVNDTANGGLNKFSIKEDDGNTTPFTILQSSPNNSIFVNGSSGYVGFQTSTPAVNLHTVNNNTPTLRLEQNQAAGFAAQAWDVGGNETNFFVRDVTNNGLLPFRIQPNAPNASLYIASDGDIGFETTTPDGMLDIAHPSNQNNHALLLSPSADFGVNIDNGFLPRSLFDVQTTGGISRFGVRSDGKVGVNMGTAGVPAGPLQVNNIATSTNLFTILDSGNVGISTSSPTAPLHVSSDSGAAKVIIENTSSSAAGDRNLLSLKNNGSSTVTFENINDSTSWTATAGSHYAITHSSANASLFALSPSGNLEITGCLSQGSSCSSSNWSVDSSTDYILKHTTKTADPLLLNSDGDLTLGGTTVVCKAGTNNPVWTFNASSSYGIAHNSTVIFNLTTGGNLTIAGSLNQGSSKNIKKNIIPANHEEILEKVVNLPISYWSYKANDDGVRHIGPIAQDFYENFGLGIDDKHIATIDTSGVALSAIKAIYQRLNKKEEELKERDRIIKELQNENERMVERLSSLEDRVYSFIKKNGSFLKNEL